MTPSSEENTYVYYLAPDKGLNLGVSTDEEEEEEEEGHREGESDQCSIETYYIAQPAGREEESSREQRKRRRRRRKAEETRLRTTMFSKAKYYCLLGREIVQ